jgi:hypothetical protein
MGLTDGENSGIPATMLVGPANIGSGAYPVYQQGGGFGNGQDGWWIVLLIILLAAGNGFGNNNGGIGGQPIIVNDSNGGSVQRGFDQAAVMSGIAGVQSGVQNLATQLCGCCGDMQTSLCNGFAGVNATVNSGFSQAEIANNARQIANMQTAFAGQTAMAQGFNQIGSQFADCCCENRLASADLKYTIATENCADRAAISEGIRDVVDSQTRGTQAILDKLCSLELDNYRRENDQLRTQLNMANLAASQTAQTSRILADNAAQTVALEQYLNPAPVPAYIVQNPNCCQQNSCGCGNF